MNNIFPWRALCEVIEQLYPKSAYVRPPLGLELILRSYFVPNCFNVADEAKPLFNGTVLRHFVGTDLVRQRLLDDLTQPRFSWPLEKPQLGEQLFAAFGGVLPTRGLKVCSGALVDATIIGMPSWTNNGEKACDPKTHQARQGRQWCLGRKMHIGADSEPGLAYVIVVTFANVHDRRPLPHLLHGAYEEVYGDSAYSSQKALIESEAPQARELTNE